MRVAYAIVFVSDMARSVAFYRDVMQIPLRFQSPHWTELATEGATLALHLADLPVIGRRPGQETPAGQSHPALHVADLDAFHRRMIESGVTCAQPPNEKFGARTAQYLDPDGLTLTIGQESSR